MQDRGRQSRKLKFNEELKRLSPGAKLSKLQQLRKEAIHLDELIEKLQPIEDRKIITEQSTKPWFDLKLIAEMGTYGASPEEIAARFFCDIEIIRKELRNPECPLAIIYNLAATDLKTRLRKSQITNAIDFYDSKMQVWLGKQLLNQSDRVEIETTVSAEYLQDSEKRQHRMKQLENALLVAKGEKTN